MSPSPISSSDDFISSSNEASLSKSSNFSYVEELLRQKQLELKDQLSKLSEQVNSIRGNNEYDTENKLVKDTLEWKIAKIDQLINYKKNSNDSTDSTSIMT